MKGHLRTAQVSQNGRQRQGVSKSRTLAPIDTVGGYVVMLSGSKASSAAPGAKW